jgi:hypothetical protein
VSLSSYQFLDEFKGFESFSEEDKLFKIVFYILDELETNIGISGYEVFLYEHFDLIVSDITQDIPYEKKEVIEMISKIIARRIVTSDIKDFVSEFIRPYKAAINKVLDDIITIVDYTSCIFENWESKELCLTGEIGERLNNTVFVIFLRWSYGKISPLIN